MTSVTTQMAMRLHLGTVVPLTIQALLDGGGVTDEHMDQVGEIAMKITDWQGTVAGVMDDLCDGLAILSFCPGGVDFMGLHWESCNPVNLAVSPVESSVECSQEEQEYAYATASA